MRYPAIATAILVILGTVTCGWLTPAWAAADHLLINEIQISGGAGRTTDDFIELYNPTLRPVDLKGMRLVKRAATSTSDTTIKSWTSSTVVPPGGYYLWANSGYSTIAVKPNTTTSQSIAANNAIALRRGAADTGTIVDGVAWGTVGNGLGVGRPYPANPPAGSSLARKLGADGNPQDTESNSDDFTIAITPTPQASPTSVVKAQVTSPATSATPPPTTPARTLELDQINVSNLGQLIETSGQVIKITKTTFTISGGGAELRVALKDRTTAWPTLTVGATTEVTGTLAQSRGQLELRPRNPDDITIVASEPLPTEPLALSRDQTSGNQGGYLVLGAVAVLMLAAYLWQRLSLPQPSALWQRLRRRHTKHPSQT